MFERIRCVLIKEFIQIFRDPRMKTVIFVMPVFQTMIFGFAVTTDVRNIPTAVYDLDNSQESRSFIREFTSSKHFNARYHIFTDKEEKELIDMSLVNVVIKIDRRFARDLQANRPGRVQLIVDGTDSNIAAVTLSYASRITEKYMRRILKNRARIILEGKTDFPGVELRTRTWFNENLESRKFYVPGVIALIVSLLTLLLTSMSIVKEKEAGTIEQLIVSPIKPIELIMGKLMPFAIIGLIDVFLITTVGVLLFDVPVRGNLFLLVFCTVIYLLTSLGIGLFISTVAATQQESMMSVFFFFFPALLLSGFIFPIANMPQIIQYLTYLNPLRYFLVILRGIFLKGSGIDILWPNMLILLIMGISILTMSSLRFKKNIN